MQQRPKALHRVGKAPHRGQLVGGLQAGANQLRQGEREGGQAPGELFGGITLRMGEERRERGEGLVGGPGTPIGGQEERLQGGKVDDADLGVKMKFVSENVFRKKHKSPEHLPVH